MLTANTLDNKRIYYNRTGPVRLSGGQYSVLGPRPRTVVGLDKTGDGGGLCSNPLTVTNSKQEIDLPPYAATGNVSLTDTGGNVTPPGGNWPSVPATAPVGIVVGGGVSGVSGCWPWPNSPNSPAAPSGFGINVSEPLFSTSSNGTNYYYPEPTFAGTDSVTEWYADPKEGSATGPFFWAGVAQDMPGPTGGPLETLATSGSDGKAASRPVVIDKMLQTGTTVNYKTLFLQRLANPSAAYDPVINPYLTVDWLPVDLTVFNGDDRRPLWPPSYMATSGAAPGINQCPYQPWDPDNPVAAGLIEAVPDPGYDPTRKIYFATRQRGGNRQTALAIASLGNNSPGYINPWAQAVPVAALGGADPTDPNSLVASTPAGSSNFPYGLNHTLGYLNVAFSQSGAAVISSAPYIGAPKASPFPWIAWNNRPYANAMELLLVPSCHPARLLWEFQVVPTNSANPKLFPKTYVPDPTAPPNGGVTYSVSGTGSTVPYPYLLNFFQSTGTNSTGATELGPQLYRILEYVTVPSPFVQTETFVNPATSSTGAAGLHNFHPPFNRISKYREPGKINLNTIYSADVLNGLMNYLPSMLSGGTLTGVQNFSNKFALSRRGYGGINDSQFSISSSYPTRFANPFRSFAGGGMVPPLSTGVSWPALNSEIDATILRHDPDTTNPNYPNRPLFQYDRSITATIPPPYNDPSRNPYFRYQALTRLGNLVTTRSNVYAFWITVGYFEVTPWTNPVSGQTGPDAGHPDGYQLGPEIGSDTGEVERHRAFYIFDRTIPVGFQRGQDLNIEKGLLLRRFIE